MYLYIFMPVSGPLWCARVSGTRAVSSGIPGARSAAGAPSVERASEFCFNATYREISIFHLLYSSRFSEFLGCAASAFLPSPFISPPADKHAHLAAE